MVDNKKYTIEEFVKEYEALCEKMGFRIEIQPIWMKRDDGSYSMVVNSTVGELPKQSNNLPKV